MDLELTAAERAFRDELRGWLASTLDAERRRPVGEAERVAEMRNWQRTLGHAGWAVPGWPARLGGRDAGAVELMLYEAEMARAHAPRGLNAIGTGWGGAAVLHHGSLEQQDRLLGPVPRGDEIWCQLFSEPDAGSDLAALTTRAVRDGEGWRIHGEKLWSSFAHLADRGILLARTDPDAPAHGGITCFVVNMRRPGVRVRQVRQMTGDADFTAVLLDGVVVDDDDRIGAPGEGWSVAITTLLAERVGLCAGEGTLWGQGPTFADVLDLWRRRRDGGDLPGGAARALLRDELARLAVEDQAIRLTGLRLLSGVARGRLPAAEMSVRKLASDLWGQAVHEAVAHLLGPLAALDRGDADAVDAGAWAQSYLFARALTIGGGTTEVQRDILARRILRIP